MKDYKLKRQKNLDKYRRQYEERKEFHKLLKEYASDIIASDSKEITEIGSILQKLSQHKKLYSTWIYAGVQALYGCGRSEY